MRNNLTILRKRRISNLQPYGTLGPTKQQTHITTLSTTKNAVRAEKFRKLGRALSLLDLEWMARRGELLGPHPTRVDDGRLSSRLYGPALKTVQLERVEVKILRSSEENSN